MAKKRATPRSQKAPVPRRRRAPKAPPPRTPPVAMAMPWLQRTADVTVSYVCPMCRTRREVAPADAQRLASLKHVPLDTLACSDGCRAQWWQALLRAIQRTGQTHVLRDMEWTWELRQGVVAERLAEVLQEATATTHESRRYTWPRRN